MNNRICLWVATAPNLDVLPLLEPLTPPANYTKPDTIARWLAEAELERTANLAKQPQTSVITAIATVPAVGKAPDPTIWLCGSVEDERAVLQELVNSWSRDTRLISYAGVTFTWAVLNFRCLYHDIPFEIVNDRYRGPHTDLGDVMHYYNSVKHMSLEFYTRWLGWGDLVGPLSGAEQAQVFQTEAWNELRQTASNTVESIRRLAVRKRLIDPASTTDTINARF